jgi:hypothetical protein
MAVDPGGKIMRKFQIAAGMLLCLCAASLGAQSLDDLNIQIHGYATQSFLYTTQNNLLTTSSSNGSPEWSEAVLNIGAQPDSKLRIGVQGRYFLLGNYSNGITLDWAQADYQPGEEFGVRFGKVKTPSGLFNDIQDIDPAYIWSLLPQGIYPVSSRNSNLAHYGGVLYGGVDLQQAGKLEYRGWGGEREIDGDDGYFVSFAEEGIDLYSGLSFPTYGAALHWRTPVAGLMLGASLSHNNASRAPFNDVYVVPAGPSQGVTITAPGNMVLTHNNEPDYFGKYEKKRWMAAAEYLRIHTSLRFAGLSPIPELVDMRTWFAMASYRLTGKLTAGAYVSQDFNLDGALGPSRFSKDWVVSGRYDLGQYLYAKAEEHFLDGTAVGYDVDLNPNGLKPTTALTVLKMGVSF